MLQACLNGGRSRLENAAVPQTANELAADARAVRDAGADELHIHPRGADGAESLDPADIAAAIAAVRRSVPAMPVGVSTGAWILPHAQTRLEAIAAWTVLPDYASVNLNEDDAPRVMDILLGNGIGIEAGVWNRADAERLVSLPQARSCLRILVEMPSDPAAAMAEYRAVMGVLENSGIAVPVLLHGQDGSAWPMVSEAASAGLPTRIGFEDVLTKPDGSAASSNAELVAAAADIMR